MKANELRIGNWVNEYGKPKQVGSVSIYHFENRWKVLEPIPITPEILEKAGFVPLPKWNVFGVSMLIVNDETGIAYQTNGWFGVSITNNRDGELIQRCISYFKHIRHLHQLQNLYFALTGQELEISL